MSSFITEYDNALSSEMCKKIIKTFENETRKSEGRTNQGVRPDMKLTTDFNISYHKEEDEWKDIDEAIYKATGETLQKYIEAHPEIGKFPVCDTGYHVQKYDKGTGFYDWHSDIGALSSVFRLVAMIYYLNDVEDGGETEFRDQKRIVRPAEGRALVFPPSWNYVHRAKMPESNDKYMVATFIEIQRNHVHD